MSNMELIGKRLRRIDLWCQDDVTWLWHHIRDVTIFKVAFGN